MNKIRIASIVIITFLLVAAYGNAAYYVKNNRPWMKTFQGKIISYEERENGVMICLRGDDASETQLLITEYTSFIQNGPALLDEAIRNREIGIEVTILSNHRQLDPHPYYEASEMFCRENR